MKTRIRKKNSQKKINPLFIAFIVLTTLVSLIYGSFLVKKNQTVDSQAKSVSKPKYIYGGNDTSIKYWPFMVVIYHKSLLNRQPVSSVGGTKYKHDLINAQFCGGTLINEKWVLTAAHCVEPIDAPDVGVAIGITNLKNELIDEDNIITRGVVSAYNPGSAGKFNKDTDIALLKLDAPVPSKFKTISISDSVPLEFIEKTPVAMLGWGEAVGDPYPAALRIGIVPLVSNKRANKKSWTDNQISSLRIAAGYPNGGTSYCFGDSGGPMIIHDGQRFVQIGLTNWSTKQKTSACGEPRDPTVGPRISKYFNWIQTTIKNNDNGKTLYKNGGTFFGEKKNMNIPYIYESRVEYEFSLDDKNNK